MIKEMKNEDAYFDLILNHYEDCWKNIPKFYLWDKGPFEKLPHNFRVLEFQPNHLRNFWTYATCCMSDEYNDNPIEIHLFSAVQDEDLVELLTTIAYYHNNTKKLGLNHTVNFGRAWQKISLCEYGFISLPYLDGPNLENLDVPEKNKTVKFYWLIPITLEEVNYKIKFGVEALEERFDAKGIDYLNPSRRSIL